MTSTEATVAAAESPAEPASADHGATLPMTAYATLGLLSREEEYTAVEVQERAHEYLRYFYWAPALSHIRRELNRLDDLGFVAAREVKQGRVKRTLKYHVTPSGEQALANWAEGPSAEPTVVKNSVLLRLWLGRRAGDSRLVIEALRDQMRQVTQDCTELAASLEQTDRILATQREKFEAGEFADPTEYEATVARNRWHHSVMSYCLRDYQDNLRNSERLLAELEELAAVIRKTGSATDEETSDPGRE